MPLTITDVDSALDAVGAIVTTVGAQVTKAVNDLVAKVAAGTDFTPEVTRLQGIGTALTAIGTAAAAADPIAALPAPVAAATAAAKS